MRCLFLKLILSVVFTSCVVTTWSQDTEKMLKEQINTHLSKGNCDKAQTAYDTWKAYTGNTDSSIKQRIEKCGSNTEYIAVKSNENGKWGFKDKITEKIVIPFKYDNAWDFNQHLDGLALVKLDGKNHYIDKNGNKWYYDEAYGFNNGTLAPVMKNGKWGYIDKNKNEVIPLKYDFAWSFNQDLDGLALVKLNGKYHYIDKNGNKWKYDEMYTIKEGLILVMKNGKWGYIDKNKNEVIPLKYDDAWSFNQHLDGLALVKLNGKSHYIDKNGNKWKYDEAYGFAEGLLAPVMKNGKWGYIDKNKNEIIPLKYDMADSFSKEGLALVKKDNSYFYINTKGIKVKE